MSEYGEAVLIKISLVCSNQIESAPQAERLKSEGLVLVDGITKAIRSFYENEELMLDWKLNISKRGSVI